jgi:hypothetical protein
VCSSGTVWAVYCGSALAALGPPTPVARILAPGSSASEDALAYDDAAVRCSCSLPTTPHHEPDGGGDCTTPLDPATAAPACGTMWQLLGELTAPASCQPHQRQRQLQCDFGGGGGGAEHASSPSDALGSGAWLVSPTGDQALMGSDEAWPGADGPEPAVRGGQRKGAGCTLALVRSHPHLPSAALACRAAACSPPLASLQHASSAPPMQRSPDPSSTSSSSGGSGGSCSMDYGGGRDAEGMEECVRGGMRRPASLLVSLRMGVAPNGPVTPVFYSFSCRMCWSAACKTHPLFPSTTTVRGLA